MCAAGIRDDAGSVCCAAECGRCGGCQCSTLGSGDRAGADFCCPGAIAANGLQCVTPADVGCVIDPNLVRPPGGDCA